MTLTVRQKRILRVATKRLVIDALHFLGSRIFGWFTVAMLASAFTMGETANFLSAEVDKHYICTKR